MKKIRITEVDPMTKTQKGLFGEGCYGSDCQDECCEYGCDVDLATLRLIEKHRELIEPLVKAGIEECFKTPLKKDSDYLGGAYRETATRAKDKTCAFRLVGQRGCSLFYLWATKKLPKRIVPTICRVYPITWHRGRLFIDTPLRKSCKCEELTPKGIEVPSLYDTQKKEIRALFEIQEKKISAAKKTVTKKVAARKASPKKPASKKATSKK
ncbi:MAG: hypothetical protein HY889_06565 [Deltaproteobacteria bacterium]|nr:hypothetical protein [Deltaproteobacteria bacterium]